MAVALYARVSTARQAEQDLSIPDQLRQMREWCERSGFLIAKEYVEPGASATDDRRPVFQEMIADATLSPAPYDLIIVHSLSRFFRDAIAFGLYERKLVKHGVKVVSISQQTSDDPAGEMARRIFSVFDEYQSKENAKHTARGMLENARQGFFNGAGAPFGYRAVETENLGNRGRRKKKLGIHEGEAATVRRIYEIYLAGYEGRSLGIKEIAKHLNERGQMMRGKPWRIQKVHHVLSCSTYTGEHYYNLTVCETRKKRPPSEWIKVTVPAIIDAEAFERVRQRRQARAPATTPPRRVSSSTLLTGLLKCGHCGAGMTLVTGKSGRYKYYKCTNRVNKGGHACPSQNVPMEKMDALVKSHLLNRVFTARHLQTMLGEARKLLSDRKADDQQVLAKLQSEIRQFDDRLNRLYEALESGVVPQDDTFQRRMQLAKAGREGVLVEMAGLRRRQALPIERVLPSQVEAFAKVIRAKLADTSSTFAKDYLSALVDEIRVTGDKATISGSYSRLFGAVADKKADTKQVPSFMPDWRPHGDSNPGYRRERAMS
jgi:site-specific DNA recombinase